MAKFTPIRIRKSDKKEYKRLVRNTRAKIRRVNKKHGIDLSGQIDLPDLEDFSTRKEFNEWKDRQKSFTNRSNIDYQFVKNPYGVSASKRRIREIEENTKKAQKLAEEKIEEQQNKPFISGGKQYGTVGQRAQHMKKGDVLEVHVPEDFDFNKMRNKQRLIDVEESMERRSQPEYFDERTERMMNNFIDTLEESFHSDAEELVDKLKDLTPDEFYDLYVRFDEFDFALFYPPEAIDEVHEAEILDQQMSDINQMIEYVDNYVAGNYNTDLKNF